MYVFLLKGVGSNEYISNDFFVSMHSSCIIKSRFSYSNVFFKNDTTLNIKDKKLHNNIYFGLAHVKDNYMQSHYGYYYPELAFRRYFTKNKYFIGVNFDLRYIFEEDVIDFFSSYYSFIYPLRLEFGLRINNKKNIYLYIESAPHSVLEPNFPPFDVTVFYLTFLRKFKRNINYSINVGMFVGPDFNDRSVYYRYRITEYSREKIMYGYSVKLLMGFL
ncbi:MAG: hypothetical protein QXE07_03225 [Thermoplasmata archaeon]